MTELLSISYLVLESSPLANLDSSEVGGAGIVILVCSADSVPVLRGHSSGIIATRVSVARREQEAFRKLLKVEKWCPEGDDVAFGNSAFIRRLAPTGKPPWATVIFLKHLGEFLWAKPEVSFVIFLVVAFAI